MREAAAAAAAGREGGWRPCEGVEGLYTLKGVLLLPLLLPLLPPPG